MVQSLPGLRALIEGIRGRREVEREKSECQYQPHVASGYGPDPGLWQCTFVCRLKNTNWIVTSLSLVEVPPEYRVPWRRLDVARG